MKNLSFKLQSIRVVLELLENLPNPDTHNAHIKMGARTLIDTLFSEATEIHRLLSKNGYNSDNQSKK